jgi:hypothetical protein
MGGDEFDEFFDGEVDVTAGALNPEDMPEYGSGKKGNTEDDCKKTCKRSGKKGNNYTHDECISRKSDCYILCNNLLIVS